MMSNEILAYDVNPYDDRVVLTIKTKFVMDRVAMEKADIRNLKNFHTFVHDFYLNTATPEQIKELMALLVARRIAHEN